MKPPNLVSDRENEIAVHLNDQAAFGSVIPFGKGLAVRLPASAATVFRQAVAAYWRQFQPGGTIPTNREYGAALLDALLLAGCEQEDAEVLAEMAARERRSYGMADLEPAPAVPGS